MDIQQAEHRDLPETKNGLKLRQVCIPIVLGGKHVISAMDNAGTTRVTRLRTYHVTQERWRLFPNALGNQLTRRCEFGLWTFLDPQHEVF